MNIKMTDSSYLDWLEDLHYDLPLVRDIATLGAKTHDIRGAIDHYIGKQTKQDIKDIIASQKIMDQNKRALELSKKRTERAHLLVGLHRNFDRNGPMVPLY